MPFIMAHAPRFLAAVVASLLGKARMERLDSGLDDFVRDPLFDDLQFREPTVQVREACLVAKDILQRPANKLRLEAVAKTIHSSHSEHTARPLMISAVQHIVGNSLQKYGITQSNMGLVFAEMHRLSESDAEIGPWIKHVASFIQGPIRVAAPSTGAAALSLPKKEATRALDDFLSIVTVPENLRKLQAANQKAVSSGGDPLAQILPIVGNMVGVKLAKYGIDKTNLLPTFAHLRSWSMDDDDLKIRMAKVMQAFGGDFLQQEQERQSPSNMQRGSPNTVSRSMAKNVFSTAAGKQGLKEAIGLLAKPENIKKIKASVKGLPVHDRNAVVGRLLSLGQDILRPLLEKYDLDKRDLLDITGQISNAAAQDPELRAQIGSLLAKVTTPDKG